MLFITAMNLVYGSTLSPPRLKQITELTDEYFENLNLETDACFQLHLLALVEQLGVKNTESRDNCAQVVCACVLM